MPTPRVEPIEFNGAPESSGDPSNEIVETC